MPYNYTVSTVTLFDSNARLSSFGQQSMTLFFFVCLLLEAPPSLFVLFSATYQKSIATFLCWSYFSWLIKTVRLLLSFSVPCITNYSKMSPEQINFGRYVAVHVFLLVQTYLFMLHMVFAEFISTEQTIFLKCMGFILLYTLK